MESYEKSSPPQAGIGSKEVKNMDKRNESATRAYSPWEIFVMESDLEEFRKAGLSDQITSSLASRVDDLRFWPTVATRDAQAISAGMMKMNVVWLEALKQEVAKSLRRSSNKRPRNRTYIYTYEETI